MQWFCQCGQCYSRDQNNHMAAPVKVARQQTTPELSEPCLRSLHQHASEFFGTLRNLPNLASGTYTKTRRQEPTSGTYASTHRNPEPSEPSGIFWKPPPEPTPAHAGTLRNLPPELAPATRTGTHRSLSGLKTPLAYAVGEIFILFQKMM